MLRAKPLLKHDIIKSIEALNH